MQTAYLIISPPDSAVLNNATAQLRTDIAAGYHIEQLFFYSDAVVLGSLHDYPAPAQALLDFADDHDIALHLCSAGFQKRAYRLSALAEQDFAFKGLGQFIAESQTADVLRVF